MSAENPQLEDGFTPIANSIMEALAHTQLSGYEWRVLFFLLRKTYGWSKKSDRIALSQFVDGTSINQRRVIEAINGLIAKNIIHKTSAEKRTSKGREYAFNKHYGSWTLVRKSAVRQSASAEKRTSLVRKSADTTDTLTTEKGLLPPTPKKRTARVTFDRMAKQFVGLTPELILTLKTMYPSVNVDQVLREAPDWAMDHRRSDYWGSLKAFCKHELENLKRGGTHGTDRKRGYRPSIEDAVFTGEDFIHSS
jgi:phage replication O-like protein O